MTKTIQSIIIITFLLIFFNSIAQKRNNYNAVYSGIPWFDNQGNIISAHGGCIIKDNGKYYFFGEKHAENSNAFAGFNCYSSTDLYNWKFENIALPVQDSGRLGPNRVGERVKVMKCPKTGEFVMLMHSDDLNYKDQCTGYAIAKIITGPYTFHGPLLFNGAPIRKWDMGTFQDTDGAGYLLVHGGEMFKLSDDYKSIVEETVNNKWPGSESPAVFKKDSLYYWLTSHLTSWERNDNYYYTATSLKGPWKSHGYFAPEGALTWNSQTTFVLPIEGSKETTYMFMGDRWSYPRQTSSATYVWQPMSVSGETISMPKYNENWQINTVTGIVSPVTVGKKIIANTDKKLINYNGEWQHALPSDSLSISKTDAKNANFSIQFTGTQIGFYGLMGKDGGYAKVNIQDNNGKNILSAIVDMYCNYPISNLAFLSLVLDKGNYILTVSVMGEHSKWSDKRKADYGSTGDFISLQKIIINE